MTLTPLGLPLLTDATVAELAQERARLRSAPDAILFLDGIMRKVREIDPLYAHFIDRTARTLYVKEDSETARGLLLESVELLRREGELPKLERTLFESRWNNTMNRALAVLNVGAQMDVLYSDNPNLWTFASDAQKYFPATGNCHPDDKDRAGPRSYILADISSLYMLMADNTVGRRKVSETILDISQAFPDLDTNPGTQRRPIH